MVAVLFTAHKPLEESGGDWLATLELIDRRVGEAPEGVEAGEIDWGRVARIARARDRYRVAHRTRHACCD